MTPRLENTFEDFHHQVLRRMAGMDPKCQRDGTWVYPPIGAALATVGLDEIGVYIYRLQNTVEQYIDTCPIIDLCLEAEQKTGLQL